MRKQTSEKKRVEKPGVEIRVSSKFYLDLSSRISDAVESIGGDDADYERLFGVVDRYMADGRVPGKDADMKVKLVFAILRPEIDKAIERSAKARERAKKRALGKRKQKGAKTLRPVTSNKTSVRGNTSVPDKSVMDDMVRAGQLKDRKPSDSEIEPTADMGRPMSRQQRRRLERQRLREERRSGNV